MGELSTKQSRAGLDFANSLAALVPQAPHLFSKKVVLQAVDRMRKFYGFSDEQKRVLIGKSIADGCTTFLDIATDTLLEKDDVKRIVRAMESSDEVVLQPLSRGNGRGRPTIYIQLTGNSSIKKPEK